ncbi:type II secretion system protein [Pseudomonas sp. 15A4]|jgi:general secretion pathway protein I|uniref:PulJ/GspJ family protein n=1 Tax=Pseudomonas sp. 15A4 TaxID=2804761 RepID=UPI00196827E9|nr:type II secretion system protein [Pseudomonas sp. 15A4]QSB18261.1 type II secretion system protein [Pseudomonas sp. 15A4]
MKAHIGQAGFTLLEMLAALVVMALCSGVLLMAFGQSARSLQQVDRADRLSQAARSVLDDQAVGALQPGLSNGVMDDGIAWAMNVWALPTAAGQPRMLRVNVIVSEGRREARFSTLRLVSPTRTSTQ